VQEIGAETRMGTYKVDSKWRAVRLLGQRISASEGQIPIRACV
jgi:hypothetical protein